MTTQLIHLGESRQIHATDFASKGSWTADIVFIRLPCKLLEFLGFLFSGHVTFQMWSRLLKVEETFNGTNMAKIQTQGS